MTDIVERLRREVPHCEDPSDYGESDLLILSAADEIERLRGWLLNIQIDVSDIADTCDRLADVIEKVRGGRSDD